VESTLKLAISKAILRGIDMKCRRIKFKNDVRMVIRRPKTKLMDLSLKGPIAISLVESKKAKK